MRAAAALILVFAVLVPGGGVLAKHKTMPCSTMIDTVKDKMAIATYTPQTAAQLAIYLARAERALALGQLGECNVFARKALELAQ